MFELLFFLSPLTHNYSNNNYVEVPLFVSTVAKTLWFLISYQHCAKMKSISFQYSNQLYNIALRVLKISTQHQVVNYKVCYCYLQCHNQFHKSTSNRSKERFLMLHSIVASFSSSTSKAFLACFSSSFMLNSSVHRLSFSGSYRVKQLISYILVHNHLMNNHPQSLNEQPYKAHTQYDGSWIKHLVQ